MSKAMKMTYLDSGFYRISDGDAGRLARAAGGRLPRKGYMLAVELPDGRRADLMRTAYGSYGRSDAPKRGWVWAVMPSARR